jgi:hypothetical protein
MDEDKAICRRSKSEHFTSRVDSDSGVRFRAVEIAFGARAILSDKQFSGSLVSSMAVGFTMVSPLVCLIAVYLWARMVG